MQTVPFSQILDGITVPDESTIQVEAAPMEWDLRLLRGEGGCRMGLTARITLQVFAYRRQEVCYITDLYSTCCTMKTQVEAVSVTQRGRPVCVREWAEELLESGRGSLFAYVTSFDCGSAITRCDVQGKLRGCKPYALWRRSPRKTRSLGHPLCCAGPGPGSACGTSPRNTAAARRPSVSATIWRMTRCRRGCCSFRY